MTDYTKLIERLKLRNENGSLGEITEGDQLQAADAIEALQSENERLKYEVDAIDSIKAERDALQSKLDELQLQEPIGKFESLPDPDVGEIAWLNIYEIKDRIVGRKVYAAPKALEPSACSDFAKEYLAAWDDGMAGDSYLRRMAEAALKCDGITKGTP